MHFPKLLILFRFLLAPAMIFIAWRFGEPARVLLLVLLYLGVASDILDGIVARKLQISTEKLRRLDSQTDLIFWLAAGISTWLIHPDLIRENRGPIIGIFVLEALCYVLSWIKFGKETCTHAFLSKLWGLTLLVAFTALLGFERAGVPFYLAVVVGFLSHADVILIVLLLPDWQHDIPSAYHAYRVRKNLPIRRNKYLNG